MRFFNYNPTIMNLDDYYNQIENNPNINGVFINVELDKNFDLQVFLPNIYSTIPLEEFLDKFKTSKKQIIINMILAYTLLTDQTSEQIASYNNVFVKKILQLISRYPNKFYLSSISTSTLYFLKLNPIPYPIGTIITRSDLGFIDVDFYVFSQYFINIDFIGGLLSRGKTVMIFPNDSELYKDLPDNIKNNVDYIIETSN
ncbi:MAG: hypothetical protein PUD59_04560 [bacterium]|nr:hypothetical protein [bacterium]